MFIRIWGGLAVIAFGLFFLDMLLSALADFQLLNDLMDAGVLGLACIFFTIMTLLSEAQTETAEDGDTPRQ